MLNPVIRIRRKAAVARVPGKIWSRQILEQCRRILAETAGRDDISGELLARRQTVAAHTLRHEDRNQVAVRVYIVTEIAPYFLGRRYRSGAGIFHYLLEPLLAVVEERLVLRVVQVRDAERPVDREAVVVLTVRRGH